MEAEQADPINITLIAIRELLMEYFKGDCIERVTDGGNVMIHFEQGHGRAGRWYASFKRPGYLMLSDVVLARLGQEPDTIEFQRVMARSPQLKAIHKGVNKFLKNYLPGVEVGYKKGDSVKLVDDEELMSVAQPLLSNSEKELTPEDILDTYSTRLRELSGQVIYTPTTNIQHMRFTGFTDDMPF